MSEKSSRGWFDRLFRLGLFFWISLAVHLSIILLATVFVVQTIASKRKTTFEAVAGTPEPSTRAMEYKVSAPAAASASSAQAVAKRIAAKGPSKIALPELPALPDISEVAPATMPGMATGNLGFGFGSGLGSGQGSGTGLGGGGPSGAGGKISIFGSSNRRAGALVGTLYDLKQTADRKDSGVDDTKYGQLVLEFAKNNFDVSIFTPFFKAPKPLFATQVMIPTMGASEGPKAFGVEKLVRPNRWLVHYKGKVSPPKSGAFRFVGGGDDIMMVKFDGKLVLDRCWLISTGWQSDGSYPYEAPEMVHGGFARSFPIEVEAGKWYEIEILIGEQPGTQFFACLLMEENGVTYEKDGQGLPILPIFRLSAGKMEPLTGNQKLPPYLKNGPIWMGQNDTSTPGLSPLDALKNNRL
jgi:hypothetical protein